MQSLNGKLIFSATDLSNFLACRHLTLLSRRTALGGPKPRQFDDPGLDVLQKRGLEHEQKFLARLREDGGRQIADLSAFHDEPYGLQRYERHAKATLEAMRAGADVVYQGCLFNGSWLGFPDFLRRVERQSELGAWSYEVVDTKLAREAKGGALLQVLLYADLLGAVQGDAPESVHLALGGPEAPYESFRFKHYAAYFRAIRKRFLEWVAAAPAEPPLAADPVLHCDICDWEYSCDRERRDVDHLSFVAGITRQQRKVLVEGGIATLEALGDLDIATRPRLDGVTPAAFERIHSQARIQLQGRRQGETIYELLPVVADQGLAALPEPTPGDLFVDLEGDPYAFELGIEYLFGVVDVDGTYVGRWSLDHAAERQTFEWFMDFVTQRLQRFPGLHIYHYAAYEPTALKRLAGQYDTRIDELDRLLRGQVFVDLYRVVRQGLRASVESYSIKKMEPLYRFERQVALREATRALANFEAWLQLGGSEDDGRALLDVIEGYNKDDCVSTLRLRDWLETLRPSVPRPGAPSPEPTEELSERLQEVRALMGRLMSGVPEGSAPWLLAQLLEYHRRENKSMWWRYFNWLAMSDEELIADSSALGGLEFVDVVREVKQSRIYRYRFPAQEHQLGPGKPNRDPKTEKDAGEIVALDEANSMIELRRGKRNTAPHPRALIPDEYVKDQVLRDSLFRL
ncbi:MAG: TM0106 family RecB-like putative nuclease, partial [Gemmatimonadota bacterium]